MKQNWFLRAAALMLVACMFCLCTIPGTISRFSSTFTTSSSSIRAGIFEVLVQRADGTWESIVRGNAGDEFTVDLYETLYQANESTIHPLGTHPNGTISNKPQTGTAALIAPGSSGMFKVNVKNLSEVDVDWTLEAGAPVITCSNGHTHNMSSQMMWKVPLGGGLTTWSNTFAGYTSPQERLKPLGGTNSSGFYGYQWRWEYDRSSTAYPSGEDQADTALGYCGAVKYTLPLTVNVVQAD